MLDIDKPGQTVPVNRRLEAPIEIKIMIVFTSFPSQGGDSYNISTLHHPDVAEDVYMELDHDSDIAGRGGSNLTFPGESLTSSHDYMR